VPPLTRYLRAHPESSNIRAVLGISQFMVRDYRACVATLRPVIAHLESTPQIAYVYADSLVKTGQRDAGIARLAALEKQNADVADVHRALGEAYMDSPDKQKSMEELRIAVRLDAANVQGHRDLGEALLAAGDAKAAIPELESATRLAPDDLDSHRELARAYKLGDRDADAARELHTVATLSQQKSAATEAIVPHTVNGSSIPEK
jgi:predicted Zn-dependent protease